MLPRPQGIFFSKVARAARVMAIAFPFCTILYPSSVRAAESESYIVARQNIPLVRRNELVTKLRKITGWADLDFDRAGGLHSGNRAAVGGSKTAREFLMSAMRGPAVVVLEDASRSADIAFCRVNAGRWTKDPEAGPAAYVVQIDFSDFEQVTGDERALEAFNVGWGLLHELDHAVNDSSDASVLEEAGECEAHINQMRRECNLPERANYYFSPVPFAADPVFITRLVRLGFEQQQASTNKKKRYWLVWDANAVGGLTEQKQIASLR
ncbi:MAG TPA: hypothetical protein VNO50_05665 [Pyrinomonadaceae bacterium]|nr:hypothetical protein [Pyrinomonadaceae bacterium]